MDDVPSDPPEGGRRSLSGGAATPPAGAISPAAAAEVPDLVVDLVACLIRNGYLPPCQPNDTTYNWKARARQVNATAWRIVEATRADRRLIRLVCAYIDSGDLPRHARDWSGRLNGAIDDARFMLDLSTCEDCGARAVKTALGIPLDPDPLLAVKAERDGRRRRGDNV